MASFLAAALVLTITGVERRVAQADEVAPGEELVSNGSFTRGVQEWRTNTEDTTLATTSNSRSDTRAAVVAAPSDQVAVLNDGQNTVASASSGERYRASAWVRTDRPPLSGQLRVRQVAGRDVQQAKGTFWLTDRSWHRVQVGFEIKNDNTSLDLNVLAWNMDQGQHLYVDDVSMIKSAVVAARSTERLSTGASMSQRGIPSRGALFGAAVGGNTDPTAFERSIDRRLGVRRTYWRPDQVEEAVESARSDLAAGRLPWISFKLPHSWKQMSQGRGDAWARQIANGLSKVPGPVWVAFHHEPEADGPMRDWTAMQEHLGPIIRQNAPNVGFTVIVTGWNQFYGPQRFSLESIWPNTKVDVAGFDVYNRYGTVKDGELELDQVDMRSKYFEPIQRWAKSEGVPWGLAETGYTDRASRVDPNWLSRTYDDLVATDGIAFTYFNSALNSPGASWTVGSSAKTAQFSRAIKGTPMVAKRR